MKVAFFLGALNQGGMESLILDISRYRESAPFEFVVLYRKDGTLSESFANTGVKLIHIKKKSLPQYIVDVRNCIRREKIDIVHSQTPSNTRLLFAALFGYPSVKVVTTFHGMSFANASFMSRKLVYHFSDKIICVSDYEKRYYLNKWGIKNAKKFVTVHNGVDFCRLDADMPLDNTLPDTKHSLKFAMVGSFMEGRNQMLVAKSIARLHNEGADNFDFYFVGRRLDSDPSRFDDCVNYCNDAGLANVHFLGGRKDVPAILKGMDGFVYCSDHDTFGIAVVEAMAAGLPVIVNDWVVMKEICTISGAVDLAQFYDSGSEIACASKIDKFIRNQAEYKSMAKVNAQHVREEYSISKHIANIYDVYSSVADL